MHKLKQLVSKDKAKGKAPSSSSSKLAFEPETTQNGKAGPSTAINGDTKNQSRGRSSGSEEATSSRGSRKSSRSRERAQRQEIEYPTNGVWPAASQVQSQRRSQKTCSLSTIQSEDEAQIASLSISNANDAQFEQYSFLKPLETVFVIDDSDSMTDMWDSISSALQTILPICAQYVYGGIEVGFPNKKGRFLHAKSAHDVETMFEDIETVNACPLGEMLTMILRGYLKRFEKWGSDDFKALNVIVIISGLPTDEGEYYEVRRVIERNARRLKQIDAEATQMSIHFFQVGEDTETTDFLQKLDDDCKNGRFVRDIVDTKTFRTYDGVLSPETVFGAVERRLNRLRKGKGKS